jgi:hypothetical protein
MEICLVRRREESEIAKMLGTKLGGRGARLTRKHSCRPAQVQIAPLANLTGIVTCHKTCLVSKKFEEQP